MGNNKDKQIRDLQKENNRLKTENRELKESLEKLNKSEKELKISKRKQDEENWYKLIKRNTYKDERKTFVRMWKSSWNFLGSLLRFFVLNKKEMKGTYVSFIQKQSNASLSRWVIMFILMCGILFITVPGLCFQLNEWLKECPRLINFMIWVLKISVVFCMAFEAKVQYLISGEIDNSYDEDFIDKNTVNFSGIILKKEK